MDHKTVESYLLSLPNTRLDYPFGKEAAVYKVKSVIDAEGDDKMFAIIAEGSDPLRLSLKCDPQLAKLLREKYVTVMEGYHLNKKHWNTLILSGEIEWEEIQGFIRHSYDLVIGAKNAYPEV
jgi:predicted DNA-binding protein (MmcQ/YjbR family)